MIDGEPEKYKPVISLVESTFMFHFSGFVAAFNGYNQYWPGGCMFFVVLCPVASYGSTGSGSDFKVSQKMGQQLLYNNSTKPLISTFI